MASCIAPISKALSAPFSRLRGKRCVSEEKMFNEIFGKPENVIEEKLPIEMTLELAEEHVQICESVYEKCLANIASLREDLARLDKTNGKYRNKFISLFTKNTQYAKIKQELNDTKWVSEVAKHEFEKCAETYREELRKTWVNTQSSAEAPFASKSTTESYFDWDTSSESASDTDCPLSGEEDNNNNNDDDDDVDTLSVQSRDDEDVEMYVADDNNDYQDFSMIHMVIPSMDAPIPHEEVVEDEMVMTQDEPSNVEEEPMVPPMNAMMQRLASVRSGIAPKDEDSVLIAAPNADDSFLAELQDDKEEEKILAGRRSSTTSSSSSATSKECASTVEVFAIAMSNRSLLDRVANMQFKSSCDVDPNNDVSEEEWV